MAPAIPDRWESYKPIGKQIEGTKFIAFKVPLREVISERVDKKIRLDSKILLKKIPNLGLIIDLTNTYRYYDPIDFRKAGVEHTKIMIPGKEIPPTSLVNRFIMTVKQFTKHNANNDKLIGVHCTHGVNRTGYFICKYMISQMAIDPNEALDRFANARGYRIERPNYIDDLKLKKSNALSSSKKKTHADYKETKVSDKRPIENWRETKVSDKRPIENWRERKESSNCRQRDVKDEHKNSSSRYSDRYAEYSSSSRYSERKEEYPSSSSRYSEKYTEYRSHSPRSHYDRYSYSRKDPERHEIRIQRPMPCGEQSSIRYHASRLDDYNTRTVCQHSRHNTDINKKHR